MEAAAITLATKAKRRANVLTNKGKPSLPAETIPLADGLREAPPCTIQRSAGTSRKMPINHWAIAVAIPDPAIPQPQTITNKISSTVLRAAPLTAATKVIFTFCNPLKIPFDA